MGGLDTSGIRWISQFERNPYPKKVAWRQDDVLNKRYYWLKNNNPREGDTLIVSILEQTITVEKTNIPKIINIKDITQATTGRLILTSVIYI